VATLRRSIMINNKTSVIRARCSQSFKKEADEFADSLGISLSKLVRISINEKIKKDKWEPKQ